MVDAHFYKDYLINGILIQINFAFNFGIISAKENTDLRQYEAYHQSYQEVLF